MFSLSYLKASCDQMECEMGDDGVAIVRHRTNFKAIVGFDGGMDVQCVREAEQLGKYDPRSHETLERYPTTGETETVSVMDSSWATHVFEGADKVFKVELFWAKQNKRAEIPFTPDTRTRLNPDHFKVSFNSRVLTDDAHERFLFHITIKTSSVAVGDKKLYVKLSSAVSEKLFNPVFIGPLTIDFTSTRRKRKREEDTNTRTALREEETSVLEEDTGQDAIDTGLEFDAGNMFTGFGVEFESVLNHSPPRNTHSSLERSVEELRVMMVNIYDKVNQLCVDVQGMKDGADTDEFDFSDGF